MENPTTRIDLARNRGADLLAAADRDLEAGIIDESGWHQRVAAVITPAYLAAATPWEQSGRSGDAESWERARGLIIDAVDRPGTFLDVGCASGYLMECLVRWGEAKGIAVEPYGLDIAPELADLARRRLPRWHDRIFVGNAIDWTPPHRFDFVRTGLEYVPTRRRKDLVLHLLNELVEPGGRLIIGVYNEEHESSATERLVTDWGLQIAGRSEWPHNTDPRHAYRVLWINRDD